MIPTEDKQLIAFQQNEVTESLVYRKLAAMERDPHNKATLERIGADERRHAEVFRKYTGRDIAPKRLNVWFYVLVARVLGITFGLKLMENNESDTQNNYLRVSHIPEIRQIQRDENAHEQALIAMIREEKLNYMSSIVLGLNDALVELTGALAGFTLALGSPQLVALTGSITGISAALSMASSEYLSTRMESDAADARKAALYTGGAYLLTVLVLILPFLLLSNVLVSLGVALASAVVILPMSLAPMR